MKTLAALFLLLPTLAFGQTFFEGSLFVTHVTESGPPEPRSEVFSTSWFSVGTKKPFGEHGSVTYRLRGSLEPLTVKEEGYPQLLQVISPASGGPLLDAMRAHDLIGEAAVDVRFRTFHVYLAPIGEPPLGPEPFERRLSSSEFAEAPFSYDVAEGWRHATRVAAAGVQFGTLSLDGGVFHEAITFDRHTSLEDGSIDSWAARATLAATPRLSLQVSHGSLGDLKEKVTSASASWTNKPVAVTALWTRRGERNAYGIETTAFLGRNVVMARGENVDERTHLTVGYIFDIVSKDKYRAGIGANVDYHSNTHDLRTQYGHKPQSVYLFARVTKRE